MEEMRRVSLSMFTEQDMQRVHEYSLKLLAENGVKYCCGSPGRVMLQIGSMEMAKRYYNLPARTIPYSTDALNCDIQCGIESYEGTMANILSNADCQLSEIGTLDGLMTTSYEKTIIDEEITSVLAHSFSD